MHFMYLESHPLVLQSGALNGRHRDRTVTATLNKANAYRSLCGKHPRLGPV